MGKTIKPPQGAVQSRVLWVRILYFCIKNLDSQARATYDDHLVIFLRSGKTERMLLVYQEKNEPQRSRSTQRK
jgi:hypothetical protein